MKKKYCKFLVDLYDDKKLMFHKDGEYIIDAETDRLYYLCNSRLKAISKKEENKLYIVIEK